MVKRKGYKLNQSISEHESRLLLYSILKSLLNKRDARSISHFLPCPSQSRLEFVDRQIL